MISALTIAEKDEALSLASGSAVFPPLSDVKDTYGLMGILLGTKFPLAKVLARHLS